VCINLARKLRAIPSRGISAVCAKSWDAMLLSPLEVWVIGWRHMSTKTSLQKTLGISLTIGIIVLWLLGVAAAGLVAQYEMNEVFDSALEETAQRILPLAVTEI